MGFTVRQRDVPYCGGSRAWGGPWACNAAAEPMWTMPPLHEPHFHKAATSARQLAEGGGAFTCSLASTGTRQWAP